MAQQLTDRRDVEFVLWEQLELEEDVLQNEKFAEFNKKTCEMILKEARNLAIKEVLPTMKDGDEIGVELMDNYEVKTPDSYKRPFELIKEGEWQNLRIPPEMGGQGAPQCVGAAVSELFMAANWSLINYATMGAGTAAMIQGYGTQEQKDMYVPKLISADWGGTMLLTEPDAGSDVGALTTTAVKNDDGTYSLTGTKIFITNGEFDLVENIIHPVLARIEGDPGGTKGISIFIVPKYFVNKDGSLGDRNDILCTGLEEKHGIHGSATATLTMGSKGKCIGWLLGEQMEGMKIMFNMMNGARLGSGLKGLSYASAAYLLALNYARERVQGRDIMDHANRDAKPVTIINHPDVRRNLLWMKSYVGGMRSFFLYTTKIVEQAHMNPDAEDAKLKEAVYDLMLPVIKDYLATKGHEVCHQSIQVLGGAGYTKDYLPEQYARDCRITSIYEGTSGIQAQDLLGRKIGALKGAAFGQFVMDIHKTVNQAKEFENLVPLAEKVEKAANYMGKVAMDLGKMARSEKVKVAFAHSLPFLTAMGDVIMAWMNLWRATTASKKLADKCKAKDATFYNGEIKTARFFIQTELCVTMGKLASIEGACDAAIEMEDAEYGSL
ncbi:MAG: acyl-CoA dehydrogenase [Proteobacteria bacterium]|nr:acyl-CoA dehydrogenase [Pseudomonadota bacterium]MBU1388642.1 acyl-CoA dehydrogenase [Pseudomonadota bacterium]MBU1544889.1 acyl-CoA dehydrogenase [Pseudomonadota bacterium]MBU2479475.1 acyl-CoA dehydrogenase [Pseudomonadota bacterium]